MAAPTQVFPPWLTAVPTTLFDGNGAPTATETTVLFLPLTYYGPSIPLGPDWTYGGLTSPATTSTILPVTTAAELSATTSPKIPPTTITAIPASLPITLSSPATPTTFPASSLPLSNSVMTTLSVTPTSASAASHTLSRGGLIGVILGSILGFIFLFIAAILLYLCMKGRRRQEDPEMLPPMTEPTRTEPLTPLTQPWVSYNYTTHHVIGWNDRSPRTSGGEADPFLAQTTDELPQSPGTPQHSNVPPFVGIARVPVPTTGSQSSKGTSKSSGTNHSGYGVLVDRPTLNLLPGTTAELERQRRGHILTTEELDRINEEAVLPQDSEGELSPLHSPYRLDPNEGWTSGNRHSPSSYPSRLPFMKPPSQNSLSAYPDADEAATLLTARRVRVEELASRSPPRLTGSFGEAYSKNGNRGLLSSLGLDRLSWFKNYDSGSRRSSRANGYSVSPLADEDPEIGQALLSPEMNKLPAPRPGLGLFAGDRPISTASGRSGNTVYHDAQSSPGTPVSVSTPITPLPRALTPSGSSGPQSSRPANSSPIPPVPPIPDLSNTSHSDSSGIPNVNHGLPAGVDVLDSPVPTAVSPFMSSSRTSNSNFSARETMTDVTDELKVHPFPPGLPAALQRSWTDEGSSITHVTSLTNSVNTPVNVNFTSSSILSSQDTSAGISIDILEEAPPAAGEGWRNLAAEQGILARRTTFGIPISSPDIMSEQGSIYSVNSHLGPTPTRSTGSDPASARRDLSGSISSASSRPSVFSAVRTHSSGRSLAHSESVSSDARKRASPVTTSFSPRSRPRSPQPPLPSPLLNVPSTAHYPPERAGTHRMSGSQDMDAERNGSSSPEPMSPVSQMSSAPWAGGLGDNWTPAP
ncbi:hypothetical protein J132_06789 [Termitomyces sp. J132]|nr:hypothetical protein H2248_008838 [Termitomyces sp. 'cryptogamus']KNZ80196.1 hypothetical protein J132_06789 [Termitomyces sp. J132]